MQVFSKTSFLKYVLTVSQSTNRQFLIAWVCFDSNRFCVGFSFTTYIYRRINLSDFRQHISCRLLSTHGLNTTLTIACNRDLQATLVALFCVIWTTRVSQARRSSLNVNWRLWRRQNRVRLSKSKIDACVTSLSSRSSRRTCLTNQRLLWIQHAGKCRFRLHAQLTHVTSRTWWNWRRWRWYRRYCQVKLNI